MTGVQTCALPIFEGFGLGERQSMPSGEFLGRVSLALIDQPVERFYVHLDQIGRLGGLSDLPGGEPGIAADRHE